MACRSAASGELAAPVLVHEVPVHIKAAPVHKHVPRTPPPALLQRCRELQQAHAATSATLRGPPKDYAARLRVYTQECAFFRGPVASVLDEVERTVLKQLTWAPQTHVAFCALYSTFCARARELQAFVQAHPRAHCYVGADRRKFDEDVRRREFAASHARDSVEAFLQHQTHALTRDEKRTAVADMLDAQSAARCPDATARREAALQAAQDDCLVDALLGLDPTPLAEAMRAGVDAVPVAHALEAENAAASEWILDQVYGALDKDATQVRDALRRDFPHLEAHLHTCIDFASARDLTPFTDDCHALLDRAVAEMPLHALNDRGDDDDDIAHIGTRAAPTAGFGDFMNNPVPGLLRWGRSALRFTYNACIGNAMGLPVVGAMFGMARLSVALRDAGDAAPEPLRTLMSATLSNRVLQLNVVQAASAVLVVGDTIRLAARRETRGALKSHLLRTGLHAAVAFGPSVSARMLYAVSETAPISAFVERYAIQTPRFLQDIYASSNEAVAFGGSLLRTFSSMHDPDGVATLHALHQASLLPPTGEFNGELFAQCAGAMSHEFLVRTALANDTLSVAPQLPPADNALDEYWTHGFAPRREWVLPVATTPSTSSAPRALRGFPRDTRMSRAMSVQFQAYAADKLFAQLEQLRKPATALIQKAETATLNDAELLQVGQLSQNVRKLTAMFGHLQSFDAYFTNALQALVHPRDDELQEMVDVQAAKDRELMQDAGNVPLQQRASADVLVADIARAEKASRAWSLLASERVFPLPMVQRMHAATFVPRDDVARCDRVEGVLGQETALDLMRGARARWVDDLADAPDAHEFVHRDAVTQFHGFLKKSKQRFDDDGALMLLLDTWMKPTVENAWSGAEGSMRASYLKQSLNIRLGEDAQMQRNFLSLFFVFCDRYNRAFQRQVDAHFALRALTLETRAPDDAPQPMRNLTAAGREALQQVREGRRRRQDDALRAVFHEYHAAADNKTLSDVIHQHEVSRLTMLWTVGTFLGRGAAHFYVQQAIELVVFTVAARTWNSPAQLQAATSAVHEHMVWRAAARLQPAGWKISQAMLFLRVLLGVLRASTVMSGFADTMLAVSAGASYTVTYVSEAASAQQMFTLKSVGGLAVVGLLVGHLTRLNWVRRAQAARPDGPRQPRALGRHRALDALVPEFVRDGAGNLLHHGYWVNAIQALTRSMFDFLLDMQAGRSGLGTDQDKQRILAWFNATAFGSDVHDTRRELFASAMLETPLTATLFVSVYNTAFAAWDSQRAAWKLWKHLHSLLHHVQTMPLDATSFAHLHASMPPEMQGVFAWMLHVGDGRLSRHAQRVRQFTAARGTDVTTHPRRVQALVAVAAWIERIFVLYAHALDLPVELWALLVRQALPDAYANDAGHVVDVEELVDLVSLTVIELRELDRAQTAVYSLGSLAAAFGIDVILGRAKGLFDAVFVEATRMGTAHEASLGADGARRAAETVVARLSAADSSAVLESVRGALMWPITGNADALWAVPSAVAQRVVASSAPLPLVPLEVQTLVARTMNDMFGTVVSFLQSAEWSQSVVGAAVAQVSPILAYLWKIMGRFDEATESFRASCEVALLGAGLYDKGWDVMHALVVMALDCTFSNSVRARDRFQRDREYVWGPSAVATLALPDSTPVARPRRRSITAAAEETVVVPSRETRATRASALRRRVLEEREQLRMGW